MDGFDDLLSSHSRNVLENPFEDPFAKPRSVSPDPWASFGQPSALEDGTQTAFLGAHSTAPTVETHGFEDSVGFQYSVPETEQHVFGQTESPSHIPEETEAETPISPTSPGFLESISSTLDDVEHPPSEETQPVREPSPPLQETPASPTHPVTPPASSDVFSSFPSHTSRPSQGSLRAEPAYLTPLDQPANAGLERSIAGLAIGGESLGGWHGAQSAFVGAPHSATLPRTRRDSDSSDDDRPILESARLAAARMPSVQAVSSSPQVIRGAGLKFASFGHLPSQDTTYHSAE